MQMSSVKYKRGGLRGMGTYGEEDAPPPSDFSYLLPPPTQEEINAAALSTAQIMLNTGSTPNEAANKVATILQTNNPAVVTAVVNTAASNVGVNYNANIQQAKNDVITANNLAASTAKEKIRGAEYWASPVGKDWTGANATISSAINTAVSGATSGTIKNIVNLPSGGTATIYVGKTDVLITVPANTSLMLNSETGKVGLMDNQTMETVTQAQQLAVIETLVYAIPNSNAANIIVNTQPNSSTTQAILAARQKLKGDPVTYTPNAPVSPVISDYDLGGNANTVTTPNYGTPGIVGNWGLENPSDLSTLASGGLTNSLSYFTNNTPVKSTPMIVPQNNNTIIFIGVAIAAAFILLKKGNQNAA